MFRYLLVPTGSQELVHCELNYEEDLMITLILSFFRWRLDDLFKDKTIIIMIYLELLFHLNK